MENRELTELLRIMVKIRLFEEEVSKLYALGNHIVGPTHLYVGQEAIAAGICQSLKPSDYITSNHRPHGHCIAKGVSIDKMMAELFGKETGLNKGRGSSMHLLSPDVGVVATSSVVAAGISIAVGIGLSIKMRKTDQVVVSFFGDGASNNGNFHEALNLAAVWSLPVVFVCENNMYAVSVPTSRSSSVENISRRASAYSIPGFTVDGMDAIAVAKLAHKVTENTRKGDGPSLIECKTYRFKAHSESEALKYRTNKEVQEWKGRCPILTLKKRLIEEKVVTTEETLQIEKEIKTEIENAVRFAEDSSFPEYSLQEYSNLQSQFTVPKSEATRESTYVEALREAIREEMRRDESTFILGEDVNHAMWAVTKGLAEEFGEERVRDTPISENTIVATALGAALTGMRPIVEIMFVDFLTLCMDQIVNQAAKVSFLSAGQLRAPMVIRSPIGLGRAAGPQHSQSFMSWFMHVPGLKIAAPSSPYDAKGLLKTAIRQDDPVMFIEAVSLHCMRENIPTSEYTIPFGKADIKRIGEDVTLVAVSAMVPKARIACDRLREKNINVELIDPRTLSPLDKDTIIDSVKKTGRLVIAEPECKTCGIGAEIAALVAEEIMDYLDAPIKRVAIPDSSIPCSPSLETRIVPNEEDIIKAIVKMLD